MDGVSKVDDTRREQGARSHGRLILPGASAVQHMRRRLTSGRTPVSMSSGIARFTQAHSRSPRRADSPAKRESCTPARTGSAVQYPGSGGYGLRLAIPAASDSVHSTPKGAQSCKISRHFYRQILPKSLGQTVAGCCALPWWGALGWAPSRRPARPLAAGHLPPRYSQSRYNSLAYLCCSPLLAVRVQALPQERHRQAPRCCPAAGA
jgi:hypothetical protein